MVTLDYSFTDERFRNLQTHFPPLCLPYKSVSEIYKKQAHRLHMYTSRTYLCKVSSSL